jgi:hypothetical protein
MMAASSLTRHVTVLGDFNLDLHRSADTGYGQRNLLHALTDTAKASGLRNLVTLPTYRSHGLYSSDSGPPAPRSSCIDHVYVSEDMTAAVHVLPDATTHHRPVLTEVTIDAGESAGLRSIHRRKTKDLSSSDVLQALENAADWGRIHLISDLEEIYSFLQGGVNKALDAIAPVKAISVRKGVDLYLQEDTLAMMRVTTRTRPGSPTARPETEFRLWSSGTKSSPTSRR